MTQDNVGDRFLRGRKSEDHKMAKKEAFFISKSI